MKLQLLKKKTVLFFITLTTMISFPLWSQEENQKKEDSNKIEYSIGTDFAFYPKWAHGETGATDDFKVDFASFKSVYNNLEARVNLCAFYKVPVPLGSHWLLKNSNVSFKGTLEVSPVTIAPIVAISFTPLPFLVFQTGIKTGTGWDIGNLFTGGMSFYNEQKNEYESCGAFTNLYAKYWLQGTFQFDTGAILKGDWKHIQLLYTYQIFYEGMTGVSDKSLWAWQCTKNKVNGVKEYQAAILAYSMPITLSRVGFVFESERFYKDNVYKNEDFRASLADFNLSAMSQFSFSKQDSLTVLLNFATRKQYETYNEDLSESTLKTTGIEWYFRRVALSYTHNF